MILRKLNFGRRWRRALTRERRFFTRRRCPALRSAGPLLFFLLLELFLKLHLSLLHPLDQRLELHDRFGAAPHQNPVYVPVAAVERAVLEKVNCFPKDQRTIDKTAIQERLPA